MKGLEQEPTSAPFEEGWQACVGREMFFHLNRGSSEGLSSKPLISKSGGAGPVLAGLKPSSRVSSPALGVAHCYTRRLYVRDRKAPAVGSQPHAQELLLRSQSNGSQKLFASRCSLRC